MDEYLVSTLFVSDLHLDAAFPAAVAQFAAFLAGPARAAEALYILGDLFETWVGDDDDDVERARVCTALRDLSDAGVACHVCHGNRDFLLGTGFEQRTGSRLLAATCGDRETAKPMVFGLTISLIRGRIAR